MTLDRKDLDPIPVLVTGARTFLELLDTPASYAGQSGKVPVVKNAENGLEFVNFQSGPQEIPTALYTPTSGVVIPFVSSIDFGGTISNNGYTYSTGIMESGFAFSTVSLTNDATKRGVSVQISAGQIPDQQGFYFGFADTAGMPVTIGAFVALLGTAIPGEYSVMAGDPFGGDIEASGSTLVYTNQELNISYSNSGLIEFFVDGVLFYSKQLLTPFVNNPVSFALAHQCDQGLTVDILQNPIIPTGTVLHTMAGGIVYPVGRARRAYLVNGAGPSGFVVDQDLTIYNGDYLFFGNSEELTGVVRKDYLTKTKGDLLYRAKVQNNYSGMGIPGNLDDENAGYSVESRWVDNSINPKEIYECIDASAGNAVWLKTSFTLEELGSAALANMGVGPSEIRTNAQNEALFGAANWQTISGNTDLTLLTKGNYKISSLTLIQIDLALTPAANSDFSFYCETGGALITNGTDLDVGGLKIDRGDFIRVFFDAATPTVWSVAVIRKDKTFTSLYFTPTHQLKTWEDLYSTEPTPTVNLVLPQTNSITNGVVRHGTTIYFSCIAQNVTQTVSTTDGKNIRWLSYLTSQNIGSVKSARFTYSAQNGYWLMEALEMFPFEQPKTITSNYTIQNEDNGKTILLNVSDGDRTITFQAPVNYADGFKVRVVQQNINQAIFAESLLNSLKNVDSHTRTKGRYAIVDFFKIAGSLIVFSGDTAA